MILYLKYNNTLTHACKRLFRTDRAEGYRNPYHRLMSQSRITIGSRRVIRLHEKVVRGNWGPTRMKIDSFIVRVQRPT